MKKTKWLNAVACVLWAEMFIALPACLGYVAWHGIAHSLSYLEFLSNYGIWALTLGTTLPQMPFELVGSLIGYSISLVVGCRIFGKERFSSWSLKGSEKQIRIFVPFYQFTRTILNLIPN